jgi:hypothetical protein
MDSHIHPFRSSTVDITEVDLNLQESETSSTKQSTQGDTSGATFTVVHSEATSKKMFYSFQRSINTNKKMRLKNTCSWAVQRCCSDVTRPELPKPALQKPGSNFISNRFSKM